MERLEKLRREALGLWSLYGESYRETPGLYQMLYEKKKRLGIKSSSGRDLVPKRVFDDYPKIEILEEENREIVWDKLSQMTAGEVKFVIKQISALEDGAEAYAFRTLRAKIDSLRYRISRHENPCTKLTLGYDPEFRNSSNSPRSVGHRPPMDKA
ncbi:MAG: hypothetical protein Q4B29_02990 [Candidatus Saccharibacteria bacterium]|nr:hypothetical protein [Candidatus Saccharibacteria bacterium]